MFVLAIFLTCIAFSESYISSYRRSGSPISLNAVKEDSFRLSKKSLASLVIAGCMSLPMPPSASAALSPLENSIVNLEEAETRGMG
jgi:hypothetical protein